MFELSTVMADNHGWVDHMDGWDGGWMWVWGTLMMLSWVAIIAGAVYLFTRRTSGEDHRDRVREILDERYARGEISAEEYREKLSHLGR